MLGRFHSLLPEIIEFRNLKKGPLTELEDENWLCDLKYMVDITKHLNDLNVQLQGPDQLLHSMFSKIKSFTSVVYNDTFDPVFAVELRWITSFPNVTSERGDT